MAVAVHPLDLDTLPSLPPIPAGMRNRPTLNWPQHCSWQYTPWRPGWHGMVTLSILTARGGGITILLPCTCSNSPTVAKVAVRTCRWLVLPLLKIWNVLLGRSRCPLRVHWKVGAGSLSAEQVTLRVFPAQMYTSFTWLSANRGLSNNN